MSIAKVLLSVTYFFFAAAVLWRGGKSIDATWALTGLAVWLVFIGFWMRLYRQPVPRVFWWGIAAFAGWTLLSFLFSSTQNYGLDEVLRTVSLGLIALWAVRFFQAEDSLLVSRPVWLFATVCTAVTFFACIVGALVYALQPVDRFVGTFFDARFHTDYWPNAWASYLLLVWPVVGFRLFSDAKRDSRFRLAAKILLFGSVFAAFFLSYSRGAAIALSGQLVLLLILFLFQRHGWEFWKRLFVVVLATLLASVVVFATMNQVRSRFYPVQSVSQKITFQSAEGTSSVSERSQFWSQAWDLSWQKPLLGWGPYSFRFVQPHVQQGVLATSDHPHNVFLKFAMERGWPAVMAFVVLLSTALFFGFRSELSLHQPDVLPFGTMVLMGVAGLLAHSLIDYNLQFVSIAFLFWLGLAYLVSLEVPATSTPSRQRLAAFAEGIVAFLLLTAAVWEGTYLVYSSIGRHAEARGDKRAALVWYHRAENEVFSRDLHLSAANTLLWKNQYNAAEREVLTYLDKNPQDARAWQLYARILLSTYSIEKAVQAYETSYQYGKYNDIGVVLGLVYAYQLAETPEKIDVLKPQIDRLLTLYGTAILQNAHFIALSDNVEDFIELAELMAERYPDDAPRYYVLAARADDHAKLERRRLSARPPGHLW